MTNKTICIIEWRFRGEPNSKWRLLNNDAGTNQEYDFTEYRAVPFDRRKGETRKGDH